MWLWRGIQSAIFYYIACTPCVEAKYQHKRRREAAKTKKERAALVTQQPSIILQPTPFETNQYWAEEIDAGPGPPKGRKGHEDIKKQIRKAEKALLARDPTQPRCEIFPLGINPIASVHKTNIPYFRNTKPPSTVAGTSITPNASTPAEQTQSPTPLGNIRDTLKASVDPTKWNRVRYERADEPLWGVGDSLSRMWNRTTKPPKPERVEVRPQRSHRRARSLSTYFQSRHTPSASYSADYDSDTSSESSYNPWSSPPRNPAINDLHPPIVSSLPRTQAEVAWMLQPPPSAAVMAGRVHPEKDTTPQPPPPVHLRPLSSRTRSRSPDRQSISPARTGRKKLLPAPIIINQDDPPLSSPSSLTSTTPSSPTTPSRRSPLSAIAGANPPNNPSSSPNRPISHDLATSLKFDLDDPPEQWEFLIGLVRPDFPARYRGSMPEVRWTDEV
ncbi:MAG: hypothetical protein Q9227_005982 [Pyrenula ochraceoflavens]